jgi:GT2 family glycosyltransferase
MAAGRCRTWSTETAFLVGSAITLADRERRLARPTGAQPAPSVFTVLLNWNGWRDTLECVRSHRKVSYPNLSIVIVDNGSSGDDVAILRRELGDACEVIENGRNDGYCEGNNVGIRYALSRGPDYVLVLNNDTVLDPDFLSHLVTAAEADPKVGVAVPSIYLYDDPETVAYPRPIDRWPLMAHVHLGVFFQFLRPKELSGPAVVRLLDGCCFLVKREVLETTGLFDPDYFFAGGSGDLGKLVMDGGFKMIAVPRAKIWAKVARSFGDRRQGALAYAYWGPRSEILFVRKHLAWPHLVLWGALLPLRIAVWLIAYGRRVRTFAVLPPLARGIWDGFRLRIAHRPTRQDGSLSADHLRSPWRR